MARIRASRPYRFPRSDLNRPIWHPESISARRPEPIPGLRGPKGGPLPAHGGTCQSFRALLTSKCRWVPDDRARPLCGELRLFRAVEATDAGLDTATCLKGIPTFHTRQHYTQMTEPHPHEHPRVLVAGCSASRRSLTPCRLGPPGSAVPEGRPIAIPDVRRLCCRLRGHLVSHRRRDDHC